MSRLLPLLVLLCACGGRSAAPVEEPLSNAEADGVPTDGTAAPPLPAGLYFRDGYVHCQMSGQNDSGDCPAPKVALLAGIHATAAEARGGATRAAEHPLPLGYPLVLHTDELGLEDESESGIAIVVGLFESAERASTWNAAQGLKATLAALAPNDVMEPRREARNWKTTRVIAIAPGKPAPAYSDDVIEAWVSDPSKQSNDPRLAKPACTVQPGELFVADANTVYSRSREWAPVTCDEKRAWVLWTDTLLESVVLPAGETHRLYQVTLVECDTPTNTWWEYDRGGRRGPGAIVTDDDGC